jgi:hypothetical protein
MPRTEALFRHFRHRHANHRRLRRRPQLPAPDQQTSPPALGKTPAIPSPAMARRSYSKLHTIPPNPAVSPASSSRADVKHACPPLRAAGEGRAHLARDAVLGALPRGTASATTCSHARCLRSVERPVGHRAARSGGHPVSRSDGRLEPQENEPEHRPTWRCFRHRRASGNTRRGRKLRPRQGGRRVEAEFIAEFCKT